MKIFNWFSDNILFVLTIFLLAFIPLYPKKPLLDVVNTWVYIRIEDFIVVFALVLWVFLLFRKKITLRTPLTLPIIIFWIIGAVATIHGVLLLLSSINGTHSNVAFLSFLRRIEYLSLFFVAYAGIKEKRNISYIIATLTVVLFCVIGYGFGQKYLGFPAYLTMNEEFAKGVPIQLSELSRVPSTFAGHYDLAAYLVLIIPILVSVFFSVKNWFVKVTLFTAVFLGFVLLFMTVSRVSFFVLLLSLCFVLYFQKRRVLVYSLFVLPFIFFVLLQFAPTLLQRFGSTVTQVDVLVSSKTGESIGHVKNVPSEYLKDKTIEIKFAQSRSAILEEESKIATTSAIAPPIPLEQSVPLIVELNAPTGENLPQGSGYINLPLSPVVERLGVFYYEKTKDTEGIKTTKIFQVHGNFLVKRALAYDLSFTTRFQGEWPNAIAAFKKNIFIGSGYGSTSLAVDNNYLRILGEVGIFGFISFFAIFLFAGIYIKRLLPLVDSSVNKSFILGFTAGAFGLGLNAVLIDVFEASKIAFTLWLLMGVVMGALKLYQEENIDLLTEVKKIAVSWYAIVVYLLIVAVVTFSSMTNYFFVGDDFTWFRWVSDCNFGGFQSCGSGINTIISYFTDANGFFYRPGTKVYFYLMHEIFWLNQTVYHTVSLLLHFTVAVLLFFLSRKILKDFFLSFLASFFFLLLSGFSEAVFWISSTGFLFNAVFMLASLLFYILWSERNNRLYFILSILFGGLSLLFHEVGVVSPVLILLYALIFREEMSIKKIIGKPGYLWFFAPIVPYLLLRLFAQSHWFSGDYSYNLLKLPFNIFGNGMGYVMISFFGPAALPLYEYIRTFSREHLVISALGVVVISYLLVLFGRLYIKTAAKEDQKIVLFCLLFFIISLLPFLGLGNITSRYSYLANVGFAMFFVYLLKKLYFGFLGSGKNIALSMFILIISIFCFVHIVQLQKIHRDWEEAGNKAERFLIAVDALYESEWAKETMDFYFVNVPIRQGDAWLFPVGLSDALWLVVRNPNIHVYSIRTVDEALQMAGDSKNKKVFEFNDDGSIIERKKIPSVTIQGLPN